MQLNPDYPTRSAQHFTGICVDLLNELQRRIGFQYNIYLTPDGKYGTQDPNTLEWNGLIGEVLEGVNNHTDYTYIVPKGDCLVPLFLSICILA